MKTLSVMRDLLLVVILIQVLTFFFWSVFAPGDYGRWLQRIDNGRFEMLECDCTVPLE